MKIEYKYIRGNNNLFVNTVPAVANAWTAKDAKRAEEAFAENMNGHVQVCDCEYLSVNYQNNTVYGSALTTNVASAMKGLALAAKNIEDFDRQMYFRSITDCTANISGNGMMITASSNADLSNTKTFEEFIYAGNKIDGIACAENIAKFEMAAKMGEVVDYDENKTYIIVSPQALRDELQNERFKLISSEIPVVYDKRNHCDIRLAA